MFLCFLLYNFELVFMAYKPFPMTSMRIDLGRDFRLSKKGAIYQITCRDGYVHGFAHRYRPWHSPDVYLHAFAYKEPEHAGMLRLHASKKTKPSAAHHLHNVLSPHARSVSIEQPF